MLVTDTTDYWVTAMLAAGVPARPVNAELADFLDALRLADMPTLLAIRETIRQVR